MSCESFHVLCMSSRVPYLGQSPPGLPVRPSVSSLVFHTELDLRARRVPQLCPAEQSVNPPHPLRRGKMVLNQMSGITIVTTFCTSRQRMYLLGFSAPPPQHPTKSNFIAKQIDMS